MTKHDHVIEQLARAWCTEQDANYIGHRYENGRLYIEAESAGFVLSETLPVRVTVHEGEPDFIEIVGRMPIRQITIKGEVSV